MRADALIADAFVVMGFIVLCVGILKTDGYRWGEYGEGGPAPALFSRIVCVFTGTVFVGVGFAHLFFGLGTFGPE